MEGQPVACATAGVQRAQSLGVLHAAHYVPAHAVICITAQVGSTMLLLSRLLKLCQDGPDMLHESM